MTRRTTVWGARCYSVLLGCSPARERRRASHSPEAPACSSAELPCPWFVALLLLNGFVAWLMKQWPIIASAHAAGILVAALVIAARKGPGVNLVAIMAYMIGSEVLWRMTKARVPWEFGKYALVLIATTAALRRWPDRPNWLPVVYFLLLVPSAFLTFGSEGFNGARQDVSFNLSGPLCLAVLMFYLSGIRFKVGDLSRVFQFLLMPIAGICSIASFTLLTNQDIVFDGRSNAAASGGFAANQVSAILGLGTLVAFGYSASSGKSKLARGFLLVLAVAFLSQAALTFSRTGVYLACASIGIFLVAASVDLKRALTGFCSLCALALAIALLIWPAMDRFTEGALTRRFQKTDSTGRDQILMSDLGLFMNNPLFGVGVGRSREERSQIIAKVANAHTEFTRMIAEHGALGLLSLGVLVTVICQHSYRARSSPCGPFILGAIAWSILFMLVSAMRLAAPALLLGLSGIRFIDMSRGTTLNMRGACAPVVNRELRGRHRQELRLLGRV